MLHDLLALTPMNFFDDFYNEVRDLFDERVFELAGDAYRFHHGIG